MNTVLRRLLGAAWDKPILWVAVLAALVSTSCGTTSGHNFGELRAAASARGISIGTAASTNHLGEERYSSILGGEFSQLQPEWEMKFTTVHPRSNDDPSPYDFSRPDALADFAAEHSMLVRGHTLLWHEALPEWIKSGGYSSEQLSAIAQDHISTVVGHYRGRVYAWDVVNEAFNDDGSMRSTIWYDAPGIGYAGRKTGYIEQALRWAHEADPNAELFYNDYGAEVRNAKSDAIYEMAKSFKKRGVPFTGIGFQMHVDLSFGNETSLSSLRSNLKRFSDLGLKIHITEFDVRLDRSDKRELEKQAAIYTAVVRACVETPNCKSVQTWGFTDKFSWINWFFPGKGWALLWNYDYGKKPSYYATLDALGRR